MEITVKHFGGQYPSFNILLHGVPGAEPFLEIKGCRIVQGSKGQFISYPSRKDDKGKYWNHVYGGEKFNEAVLKIAQKAAPTPQAPQRNVYAEAKSGARPAQPASGFDDMQDDVPW